MTKPEHNEAFAVVGSPREVAPFDPAVAGDLLNELRRRRERRGGAGRRQVVIEAALEALDEARDVVRARPARLGSAGLGVAAAAALVALVLVPNTLDDDPGRAPSRMVQAAGGEAGPTNLMAAQAPPAATPPRAQLVAAAPPSASLRSLRRQLTEPEAADPVGPPVAELAVQTLAPPDARPTDARPADTGLPEPHPAEAAPAPDGTATPLLVSLPSSSEVLGSEPTSQPTLRSALGTSSGSQGQRLAQATPFLR